MAVVLFYHVWMFLSHGLYGRRAGGHVSGNHEWRYPCFFAFQGYCCVFRPYDQVRYIGIYNNCNLNGLFYLEVLAAIFGKILYVTKENKHKFWRVYYWLGAGVVYSFLFMTIGRTAWMVSFVLGLIFLGFYQSEKRKSSISEMVCCWYCVYV